MSRILREQAGVRFLRKEDNMVGGFSTPRKDKALKVSAGQLVNTSQMLSRGIAVYKAGKNVKGIGVLQAVCPGKIYFTKKKTSHGRVRTFINVEPVAKKSDKDKAK